MKDYFNPDGITTFKIQNPGTAAAIFDPRNIGTNSYITTKDDAGRDVDTYVRFFQANRTAATTGKVDVCSVEGDTTSQLSQKYEANIVEHQKIILDENEFVNFCGSGADINSADISQFEYARELMEVLFNNVARSLSTSYLSELSGLTGKFSDGTSAAKTIQLLKSDGSINPVGEVAFKREFRNLEVSNPTDITAVGDGILSDYFDLREYSCCSDAGQDVSKVVSPFDFYRDPLVSSELDSVNNILAWRKGTVMPFFKTDHKVEAFRWNDRDYVKTYFEMPFEFNGIRYMIPLDLFIYYDKCGTETSGSTGGLNRWKIALQYQTGLATVPTNIEASGSPFEGVNYVLPFLASCGDTGYCS
jgi:hypothetical protein